MDLYNLTQVSAYDYFRRIGLPSKFIYEFIDGASRDNYNQDGSLNALADLVSLAGAGLAGDVFERVRDTLVMRLEQLEADLEQKSAENVRLRAQLRDPQTESERLSAARLAAERPRRRRGLAPRFGLPVSRGVDGDLQGYPSGVARMATFRFSAGPQTRLKITRLA